VVLLSGTLFETVSVHELVSFANIETIHLLGARAKQVF